MANILLSTIIKDAASRTSGIKLKDMLLEMIGEGNEITVDFTGMSRYASPFFNNSFAALYIALDPNNPEYKDEIASIVSQTPKVV